MKIQLIGDLIEKEDGSVIARLDIDAEGRLYLMQRGFEAIIMASIDELLDGKIDWDESRVDIVGQNGNDGLHYDELEGNI